MESKKFNARRFLLVISLALAGLSLGEFLIYYIFFGFLYQSSALLVTVSYLISFIEGLFPLLAATALFFASDKGTKGKSLIALALSAPKILYVFPRYYLYFVSDVFNSIEAVMLSLLVSVLYTLYVFLQIFVCIIILKYAVSRNVDTESELKPSRIFSLECGANFGIVLESIFIFVIFFAKECFNTISYFSEVGGGYTGEEIIMMVISFLILPIFAFFYYLISAPIKNKILSLKTDAESEAIEN